MAGMKADGGASEPSSSGVAHRRFSGLETNRHECSGRVWTARPQQCRSRVLRHAMAKLEGCVKVAPSLQLREEFKKMASSVTFGFVSDYSQVTNAWKEDEGNVRTTEYRHTTSVQSSEAEEADLTSIPPQMLIGSIGQ